jgi:hypothetical protein
VALPEVRRSRPDVLDTGSARHRRFELEPGEELLAAAELLPSLLDGGWDGSLRLVD